MSSAYETYLPNAFPWVLKASMGDVQEFAEGLMAANRSDELPGSSFAVTVEHAPEAWYIWLSDTSAKFLKTEFFIGDSDLIPSRTVHTRGE